MSKTTRVIFYLPSLLFSPIFPYSLQNCAFSRAMFIVTFFYCFYSRTSPQMQTELRLTPDPMTHSTSTMKCLPIRKPEGWMWDFHTVVHGKSMPIVFQKNLTHKVWNCDIENRCMLSQALSIPIKTPNHNIVNRRKISIVRLVT